MDEPMKKTEQPTEPSLEWSNSLWDCCSPTSTCLVSWCLPCCLHGKTQSRLQDPALKEHSYLNGDCCLFTLTSYCSLHWVILMIRRGEMRQRFGIKGSAFEDCWQSYCCPCCTLMQHEKEVEARSNNPQAGYQATPAMTYPQ